MSWRDVVENLDLTRSYIYVLELEDERYYIGRTSNIVQRMNEHFRGDGALYTKKYKPIKIKEIIVEKTKYDERDKTLECMEKYGWDKVRGYAWCNESLSKKPKIKKKIVEKEEVIIYDNDEIRNLYVLENKDIIEIGKYLNKTPGSIAYNLEKMGIVERRQLSRGYFDYIFSELYEVNKKSNEICRENISKVTGKYAKSELSKDELKNVKARLHDIMKQYKN